MPSEESSGSSSSDESADAGARPRQRGDDAGVLGVGSAGPRASHQSQVSSIIDTQRENELDNVQAFLEEHGRGELYQFCVQQGCTRVLDIALKLAVSSLVEQGMTEDAAIALMDAAQEEDAAGLSDSGSDAEELTELERQPAGDKVLQVFLPRHIKDEYCFLEVLHEAGSGRCVFLCEKLYAKLTRDGSDDGVVPDADIQIRGPQRAAVCGPNFEAAVGEKVDGRGRIRGDRVGTSVHAAGPRQGPRCILKVWRKDARPQQETAAWLDCQLKLLRLERHQNVCLPRRILEDERAYYVEFDVIGVGTSLMRMILNDPSTTEKQVKKIIKGVLRGLSHLHTHGFSHRDIKAENVLLEWRSCEKQLAKRAKPPNGWISIKRGISRWRPAAVFKSAWTRHDLMIFPRIIDMDTACETKKGKKGQVHPLTCGSIGYIAPEAYLKFGGHAADLFAVGVLAYMFVACEAPFHDVAFESLGGWQLSDAVPRDVLQRVRDATLAKVERLGWDDHPWSDLPLCRDFCRMLLHPNPKARGTDAQEVLESHPWFQRSAGAAAARAAELRHLRPETPLDHLEMENRLRAPQKQADDDEEEPTVYQSEAQVREQLEKRREARLGSGRRGGIVPGRV